MLKQGPTNQVSVLISDLEIFLSHALTYSSNVPHFRVL
jgi:hypothetical protein